ncbi:MAG: hypothetical protein HYT87_20065 [Nitrospirae bacterium]|nr:hypothetical protein [Nitrospirota bacterium]
MKYIRSLGTIVFAGSILACEVSGTGTGTTVSKEPSENEQTAQAVASVADTTQTLNETVETVQTVTELTSTVESLSETGSTLQSASSAGSATSTTSTLGGIRGAPARADAAATETPDFGKCDATPTDAAPLPCHCIYKTPEKFGLDQDAKCAEHVPGAAKAVVATVRIKTTDEADIYKITIKAVVPAKADLPADVKKHCVVAGTEMTCSADTVVVKRCKDDGVTCFFVPAPAIPEGSVVFINRRFELPDDYKAPEDFKDQTAVTTWLKAILEGWNTAKNDDERRAFIKRFLIVDNGWVTEIKRVQCEPGNEKQKPGEPWCPDFRPPAEGKDGAQAPHPVKESGMRFISRQVPPPVLPGETPSAEPANLGHYEVDFRMIDLKFRMPGEQQPRKTQAFRVALEKPGEACTPVDLKGQPLSGAPSGRLITATHAAIEAHGGYENGGRKACRAVEKVKLESGKVVTPTSWVSQEFARLQILPVPPPDKAPARYPVTREEKGKHYLVVDPPEKVQKEREEKVGTVADKDRRPGAGGTTATGTDTNRLRGVEDRATGEGVAAVAKAQSDRCPGHGEGITNVTIKFNDGRIDERVHRYLKEEGVCQPTPLDEDGNPIPVEEDEKGNLKIKIKDKKGQDLDVSVENPESPSKTIKISAGFVSGYINLHEADENGVIGEGTLNVTVPGTSVEVSLTMTEAGWQHVQGKATIKSGKNGTKTMLFWQDRTESGALIKFKLVASGEITVAESAEAQAEAASAEGSLDMTVPSDSSNACEEVGQGSLNEAGTGYSLTVYEDTSTLIRIGNNTVNVPVGCAGGGTPATTTADTVSAATKG